LAPEQTEGPYYLDLGLVRADITEGRPGAPLQLRLTVVGAGNCQPIEGAMVDIWHCDALGTYSGVGSGAAGPGAGPGSSGGSAAGSGTFLRGIQPTSADGVATFTTIYPGWYRGRTTHIHVKVHVDQTTVHTGQLYFDDTLTDTVYQGSPYDTRPNRDTRNAGDGIFRDGGARSMLTVTPAPGGSGSRPAGGYVGTITMGIAGGGSARSRL
jgi:protocatechuate 3,4-dioxygenase beta subunit